MKLLQDDSTAVLIMAGLVVFFLLVIWVLIRVRRARNAERPRGAGSALAYCLDGDLAEARIILESRIRLREGDLIDNVVGLIAVLRAQGELQRARGIINRLVEPGEKAWVDALRIRLELDAGDTKSAADYVVQCRQIPVGLAIAALARDGRWTESLRLYRQRTSRKTRSSRLEAELLAGSAAEAFRAGQGRAGRKALKKALSLNEDALLPLLVGARYHSKEVDRDALRDRLKTKWPWSINDFGETIPVGPTSDVLTEGRAAYAAGNKETARATLRDRLDVHPADWRVRQQYTAWVLDEDNPKAWRAELAELASLLTDSIGEVVQGHCSHCGLAVSESVIICPRCDSIGTVGWDSRRSDVRPRYLEDPSGALVGSLFEE
jgi:hypothetical protein